MFVSNEYIMILMLLNVATKLRDGYLNVVCAVMHAIWLR